MAQDGTPAAVVGRAIVAHALVLDIQTEPSHQQRQQHEQENYACSHRQQVHRLELHLLDPEGGKGTPGHPAQQSAGCDQTVPALALLRRVDGIGETPELLYKDHAQHVHEDIETEGKRLAGLAHAGEEDKQQHDDGRAGAQHHADARIPFNDAVINGDDQAEPQCGRYPHIGQLIGAQRGDEDRTAGRLEVVERGDDQEEICEQQHRPRQASDAERRFRHCILSIFG